MTDAASGGDSQKSEHPGVQPDGSHRPLHQMPTGEIQLRPSFVDLLKKAAPKKRRSPVRWALLAALLVIVVAFVALPQVRRSIVARVRQLAPAAPPPAMAPPDLAASGGAVDPGTPSASVSALAAASDAPSASGGPSASAIPPPSAAPSGNPKGRKKPRRGH